MSIREEIQHRCAEGRLHLLSLDPDLGETAVREFYASTLLQEMIVGPWTSVRDEDRWWRLRADLDSFTKGDLITVPRVSRKAGKAYMTRLAPDTEEVWEIRSRDPKPSIRVFGRFAEKDVFIALQWDLRTTLGAFKSRQWRDTIEQCKTDWRNLFASYQALNRKGYPDDYISNVIVI